MQRPIRSQTDDRQLEYSQMAVTDTSTSEDMARQEWKDDADVNLIIKRMTSQGLVSRPVQYIEVDYDLDLQNALGAVEAARTAWWRMPVDLREQYKNWSELLLAMQRGEVKLEGQKGEPIKPTPEDPNPKQPAVSAG